MILQSVFPKNSIILDLESEDKDELFEELLQNIVNRHDEIDRDEAMNALKKREEKMTTGILPAIAVPHCSIDTVQGVVGAIGISKKGIEYGSLDGEPVHFIFMMICNASDDSLHLTALHDIAVVLKSSEFIDLLGASPSVEDVWEFLGKSDFFFEA